MEAKKSLWRKALLLVLTLTCVASSIILYKHLTKLRLKISSDLCVDCDLKIPKIIHRVWIPFTPENKEPFPEYMVLDKILKDLHPDWQFMEWDESRVEKLVREEYPQHYKTFMSYDQKVKKHDASRYFILHKYGGVFIQHSLSFFKNIEPLIRGYDIVFSQQQSCNASIYNGWMACVQGHEFYDVLIKNLENTRNLSSPLRATGPGFVTRTLKQYIGAYDHADMHILSHKFVLPFDGEERYAEPNISNCIADKKNRHEKCRALYKDAYAYSLWKSSWIPLQDKK